MSQLRDIPLSRAAQALARSTGPAGAESRHRIGRAFAPRIGTALIVLALLGLLQAAGELSVGGIGILPTTTQVLGSFPSVLSDPATYSAIEATLASWSIGFGIAVVGGIAIGLLVGLSKFTSRSTTGLFDFLRSTPAVAFIPMAELILGIGLSFKVTIIVVTCIWVMLLQTTAGLRSVDALALESAKSLHMSRSQRIRWVLIPTALPYLLTGMRLAAVNAFLASIGVELLASAPGIGREIMFRQLGGAAAEMWDLVVIAAVLGVLVSLVFTRIESVILRWHVSQRDRLA